MAISARELTLILRVQSAGAGNIRRMAADLNQLERHGLTFNERFQKASQSIGAVGKQLQLVGGIATGALGFAANYAANLQSQVTLAATQVANNVHRVNAVATRDFQGILNQMTKFPSSADDMAKSLYDLYSTLNITAKQGIPLLQVLNKAAVAGGLSSQEAGQGLLSVLSNFKEIPQTASGATRAFTRMFAAVRFGRLTMQQFSTTLATTAPAAKIAGQNFNNMAGTLAFLSRALGPSKASVGYARLVEVLSGSQMQEGLKSVGVNIDGTNGKMLQLDKVIQILVRRFPYLAQGGIKALNFFKDIGNIQSTIQARRAFATLVHDVGGYRDILKKTTNDNNEFGKSYQALAQSLGVQWAVLINNLKAIALTIGMAVIPAFVQMSKPLIQAVHWFQSLDPAIQRTIGRMAAFIAVGALVGGTFLTVAAGIGVALSTIAALGGAVGLLVAGFGAYLTFAVIGKKIYDNWDSLGGLFKTLGGNLKDFFQNIGQALKAFYTGNWNQFWSHLGDAVGNAWSGIKTGLELLKSAMIDWFKGFFTSMQGIVTAGLAGMFVMARRRGGAGAGIGEGVGNLDFLNLALQAGGVPAIGINAGAKAADVDKFLEKMGGTAGIKQALAANAFTGQFSARQARNLEAYVVQQETAAKALTPRLMRAVRPLVNPFAYYREQVAVRRGAIFGTAMEEQLGTGALMTQAFNAQKAIQTTQAAGLPLTGRALSGLEEARAAAPQIGELNTQLSLFEKLGVGAAAAGATIESGFTIAKSGAVAAKSAFSDAGKSLLSFIGLGNPFLGAAVAIGAAGFLVGKKINDMLQSGRNAHELVDTMDKAQAAMKSFRDGVIGAADSMQELRSNRVDLRHLTNQMNNQKDALDKLTPGTKAYADASKRLAAITRERARANLQVISSQEALNSATAQANANATTASKGIDTAFSILQGRTQVSTGQGIAPWIQSYISAVQTAQQSSKDLLPDVQALNAAISAGADPKGMRRSFAVISSIYAGFLNQGKEFRDTLTRVQVAVGHAFNPAELQFFMKNIKADILPGVAAIAHHIHALPSRPVIRFLSNHKQVQLGIAAIVDQFNRLPTSKEMKVLLQHRSIDEWIAQFINKFHRMPTDKQIRIHIQNVNEVRKQIADTERHINQIQSRVHQVGRIGAPGKIKINTSAVDTARKKIDQLNKDAEKKTTKHVAIAFNPSPDRIISSYQSLVKGMSTIGTNAGTGWAHAFSATAQGTASAHVNLVVNAFRRSYKVGSPSRVMRERVGDPLLQGILAGLKDKKSIQDAANQSMSTMVDAYEQNRSTFQDQLGALFTGATTVAAQQMGTALQQKIDWGENLNIKDLQRDLGSQIHTFRRFQGGVNRLMSQRGMIRHTAFFNELRSMGPAAQGELDALLRATPRQLRRYIQMWEKSQRLVNHQAKIFTLQQYKAYMDQGRQVALGFLAGLQGEQPMLERYFRRMFLSLLHNVKRVHRSHSPSLAYMQEGLNVARGFQLGVAKGLTPLRLNPAVGGFDQRRPQVASVTNNYYYNRTYNVYPQKTENLLSALRKHDHVTRHRP